MGNTCPVCQKACCYDSSIDLSVFGIICINPQQASSQQNSVPWTQGCRETARNSAKMCGTRQPAIVTSGGDYADSAPGEFPFTCLLLTRTMTSSAVVQSSRITSTMTTQDPPEKSSPQHTNLRISN